MNEDNALKIQSYDVNECNQTLSGHKGSILSLTVIPKTELIVSGSADKTIKIWNY